MEVFSRFVSMSALRAEFPVLGRLAYLNAGTDGPLPARSAEAARARYEHELHEGRSGAVHWDGLDALCETTRARLAGLMGAGTDEVALTRSATDAINLVLGGLELGPGDEVLTTDEEHAGMLAPLAAFARRTGAVVRVAPFARAADAVEERTRLIAVSQVSWMSGQAVATDRLSETGVPLLIDGAQGLGAVPTDVRALGCAFYAAAGQKWLCGPDGTGALFVAAEWIERLGMPRPGYGTIVPSSDPLALAPRPGARCLDTGSPNGPALAGALAALDVLEELGWDRAFQRSAANADRLALAIAERQEVLGPRASPLVTWVTDRDPEEQVAALAARGVIVRDIPGRPWLRASVGAWNSEEDLERLLAGL
jgi:selenocysteine lyase/cysteine desulfurase